MGVGLSGHNTDNPETQRFADPSKSPDFRIKWACGGMAEWSMAVVLKTRSGVLPNSRLSAERQCACRNKYGSAFGDDSACATDATIGLPGLLCAIVSTPLKLT